MNAFFKLLQPTIVKTSDDEDLREDMRNLFLVNFNIFGIDYFDDNYILSETADGEFYFALEDYINSADMPSDDEVNSESTDSNANSDSEDMPWHIDLENSNVESMIDIPRIYIRITDNFIQNYKGIFQNFISAAFRDNSIYGTGIEGFKAGEDYFLNKTLYDYLYSSNIIEANHLAIMPNYLEEFNKGTKLLIGMTKYWVDREGDPDEYYTELEYYLKRNLITNYIFNEDELSNFYSTFCGTILKLTNIDDSTRATHQNQIYDLVLNYWNNFGNDCASNAINLVLNSMYAKKDNSSTCGCNTSVTNDNNISTTSCNDLYKSAMVQYLIDMLGDNSFYEDWFTIISTDSLGSTINIKNQAMCEILIKLCNEFVELTPVLKTTISNWNCDCPSIYGSSNCDYNVIKNYVNVLGWVKENEINKNINKIKIFGKQFGEMLPSLQL